jgi:hypothetical protein
VRWPRCTFRGFLILGIIALTNGCSDDSPVTSPEDGPMISDVQVEMNPHNNLSMLVSFDASNVDEVRVRYTRAGGSAEFTPWVPATESSMQLATLGLEPLTTYEHVVEGRNSASDVESEAVEETTGDLPDFLRDSVSMDVVQGTPTPGWTTMGLRTAGWVIAFDDSARIRWYRKFDGIVLDAHQHPNGHFTTFLGASTGAQPTYGYFAEYTPDGTIVARHQATAPLYTDGHELVLSEGEDGWDAHLFSYDIRRSDLTAMGGPADVLLAGHQILRFDPSGQVTFSWNSWDHFVVEDWIEEPLSLINNTNSDWDHPNSLDIDLDGNYIVSFRNLGEISKIDYRTGEVIWRMGGRNNQFLFVGDEPFGLTSGQHCVRVLDNGHLLVYDNGLRHTPPETRIVEFEVDAVSTPMTVTRVWQYRHAPAVYTPFTGAVQRLDNGNTFIGYAGVSKVVEVDAGGDVVWEADIKIDGATFAEYRMNKVPSLYEYIRP